MRGSKASVTSIGQGEPKPLDEPLQHVSMRGSLDSAQTKGRVPPTPHTSLAELDKMRASLQQSLLGSGTKGSILKGPSKDSMRSIKGTSSSKSASSKKLPPKGSKESMHSDQERWKMTALKPESNASLGSALDSVNQKLPNVEHDFKYTKLFLQKQGLYNMSIWSHLTDVLNKIISEQPENVVDYFEEYSRRVKEERLVVSDTLRDIYVSPPHLKSATDLLSLVKAYGVKELPDEEEAPPAVGGGEGEEEEGETAAPPPPPLDLEEKAFYFRQAGVAIPDMQLFMINIAMKKLTEEKSLVKPRFWGKIFGTKQDYFVLESELADEEYETRVEAEAAEAERLEAEKEQSVKDKEGGDAETESQKIEEKKGTDEKGDAEEKAEAEEQEPTPDRKLYDEIFGEDIFGTSESKDKLTRKSFSMYRGVSFDLGEAGEEEEEEEDPLLPPLPPPKKLLTYVIPPLLEPVIKETVVVPPEKIGEGLNRKVYFVANSPELEWTELPKVTPQLINLARQIKVYFTGDLDAKIVTYPEFPGTERDYLRAQIARISASTLVSPKGFYRLGEGGGGEEEEEEEAEEGEEGEGAGKAAQTKISENPKFAGVSVKELLDSGLGSWMHHSPHVLRQGRAVWWASKPMAAGEEEDEEKEEEEEEEEEEGGGKGGAGEEKETGPPLLSPLADDSLLEGSPAWVLSRTRSYNNQLTVAVIRSTRWPGHTAFAKGRQFENIYCGWGHKGQPLGFSPAMLPHPEYEYELGPEILEIQDPTVEVEQAWRQAHRRKPPPPPEPEETEGEEGEEEEEEEDD